MQKILNLFKTFLLVERLCKDVEEIRDEVKDLEAGMAKNFDLLRGEVHSVRDEIENLGCNIRGS